MTPEMPPPPDPSPPGEQSFSEGTQRHVPSAPDEMQSGSKSPSGGMKSVRRWREVLVYLPPAVLVVIAAQQVAVTRVEHLTPWKGGGFGMFSSIDMPTKRIVRGFLTKAGRETPISLPPGDPLERPMSQLKTLPSSGRIEEIADALARRSWSIDPKTRLASPVEREAAELRSSPGSAIRLEVYRLYFHPDTDEVERVLLTSVSRNLHE